MGHIEPQRERWAESDGQIGPPVWQLVRGLVGGGLVYQHSNGAVVHLHDNGQGLLEPARCELTNEFGLPDRGALAEIVNRDVERMAAAPSGRATLMMVGVSELAVVRPPQGRPLHWTEHELLALAREFLEHGDRWTSDHERWARKSGREPRDIRKLMRRAESAGIVSIEKSAGPRSPNVYRLTGSESAMPDAKARADWHRRAWLELEGKRQQLGRASRRSDDPVSL